MGSVAFDRVAGPVELALIVASLSLLLAALTRTEIGRWRIAALAGVTLLVGPFVLVVWPAARYLSRWPGVGKPAIAVSVLAALTVAQPFGVRAESVDTGVNSVPAELLAAPAQSPTETESIDLLGVPVLEFTLYRREINDYLAGLGECCPATHDLQARSWVLPGVLTHATEVTGLCGDNPCWGPEDPHLSLREVDGQWYALLDDPSKTTDAWKLTGGIASTWGLLFWIAVAIAIAVLLGRRRRAGPGNGG